MAVSGDYNRPGIRGQNPILIARCGDRGALKRIRPESDGVDPDRNARWWRRHWRAPKERRRNWGRRGGCHGSGSCLVGRSRGKKPHREKEQQANRTKHGHAPEKHGKPAITQLFLEPRMRMLTRISRAAKRSSWRRRDCSGSKPARDFTASHLPAPANPSAHGIQLQEAQQRGLPSDSWTPIMPIWRLSL